MISSVERGFAAVVVPRLLVGRTKLVVAAVLVVLVGLVPNIEAYGLNVGRVVVVVFVVVGRAADVTLGRGAAVVALVDGRLPNNELVAVGRLKALVVAGRAVVIDGRGVVLTGDTNSGSRGSSFRQSVLPPVIP